MFEVLAGFLTGLGAPILLFMLVYVLYKLCGGNGDEQ